MWKIKKRGEFYQAIITVPDHPRIRRSTRTGNKAKAEEIARKWEADAISASLGKPTYVWEEAVVKWLKNSKRKSIDTDKSRLRYLAPYMQGVLISDITPAFVWDVVDELCDERELTPSTQNKYMALIRAILNCCEEWEWIERAPKFKKRKEVKKRVRWITREESHRLLFCLPKHQRAPVRLALELGLRKSNLYSLTWEQIDLDRKCAWIHGDQAKAGDSISIPLNENAVQILSDQAGKDPVKVFCDGKIEHRTFQNAVKKAGITDFRFHDLRHTWASWHVQRGTSLQQLMELGGWHSYEMVLRYAHLNADHLKEAAENICHKYGT